jgi:hypothetical protein
VDAAASGASGANSATMIHVSRILKFEAIHFRVTFAWTNTTTWVALPLFPTYGFAFYCVRVPIQHVQVRLAEPCGAKGPCCTFSTCSYTTCSYTTSCSVILRYIPCTRRDVRLSSIPTP